MPRKKRVEEIDLTGETDDELEAPPQKPKARKRKAPGAEGEGAAGGSKKGKGKAEKRVDASGRAVRWSAQPNQQTKERIARAMPGSGHRLFLIDRKVVSPVSSEGGGCEEFAVLGNTGNVYTVTICRQPQCTCPDFCKRGNVCKHILFVNLRVLRLPRDEPLVWQRGLLTEEVDSVLSGEKSMAGGPGGAGAAVLAGDAVRAQYRRLSGVGADEAEPSSQAGGNRKPIEGNECPICMDPFEANPTHADDKVTFCAASCGNNVHVGCMRRWCTQHQPPTCPFCRAPWVDGLNPGGAGQGGTGQQGVYTNLAQFSEAHRGGGASLEELYGDRAVWIRANQGELGRGAAANMWRTMRGGW